jgi:Zn-dependent peptidase ImmA (M78 family)
MKRPVINEDGPIARRLRSYYGNLSVREITRNIAKELLSSTNQTHPPINVNSILPIRHVNVCTVTKMYKDGRIRPSTDGFIIEIAPSPQKRQRFTLAHEIGHTYFYDLKPSPPQRILYDDSKDEETFCNLFASEILMPAHMVQAELKQLESNDGKLSPLDYFDRLVRKFNVSIEAMTRRLIEDLELFHGIALGSRWLPGLVSKTKLIATDSAWRLTWWAASPEIITPLYLPFTGKRPKLGLQIAEQAYINRERLNVRLDLKDVQLGNLKKILRGEDKELTATNVWVRAYIPKKVTPDSDVSMQSVPSIADSILREHTEVILFFPLQVRAREI